MSMHLLAPASKTSLRAEGRLIRRGNRQDVAGMHLYDGDGKLLAHATGTFVLLPKVSLSNGKESGTRD
jgi:acyl-coenzyme A thioesterase PaaI-like protein